eukprot:350521-Chlamydomonas_euryale.AAC.12
MDGKIYGFVDGWIMDGRMDGRRNGWMDGWMDGWMRGGMEQVMLLVCRSLKAHEWRGNLNSFANKLLPQQADGNVKSGETEACGRNVELTSTLTCPSHRTCSAARQSVPSSMRALSRSALMRMRKTWQGPRPGSDALPMPMPPPPPPLPPALLPGRPGSISGSAEVSSSAAARASPRPDAAAAAACSRSTAATRRARPASATRIVQSALPHPLSLRPPAPMASRMSHSPAPLSASEVACTFASIACTLARPPRTAAAAQSPQHSTSATPSTSTGVAAAPRFWPALPPPAAISAPESEAPAAAPPLRPAPPVSSSGTSRSSISTSSAAVSGGAAPATMRADRPPGSGANLEPRPPCRATNAAVPHGSSHTTSCVS